MKQEEKKEGKAEDSLPPVLYKVCFSRGNRMKD